ncbi:hypothetical protein ACLMJK_000836 [Lecanora helva]
MALPKHFGSYGSRRGKIVGDLTPTSYLIRKPIQKGIPLRKPDVPELHHGQHIYLFNNIRTNQVVYSLTRHLNNKDSLDQIPFLGKKTVPPRLRKDLWTPFAMVYFPSPHAGLAAYRKLREFRRLHETTSNLEDFEKNCPRKKRGRELMNQKANSIADLAAVLLQQEKGPSEGRVRSAETRMAIVERLKKQKGEKKVKKNPLDVKKELEGVDGVIVRWADLYDTEYASAWPDAVKHDELLKNRHTAAWPVKEEEDESAEFEELQGAEPPQVGEKKEQGWRDKLSSWIPGKARDAPALAA